MYSCAHTNTLTITNSNENKHKIVNICVQVFVCTYSCHGLWVRVCMCIRWHWSCIDTWVELLSHMRVHVWHFEKLLNYFLKQLHSHKQNVRFLIVWNLNIYHLLLIVGKCPQRTIYHHWYLGHSMLWNHHHYLIHSLKVNSLPLSIHFLPFPFSQAVETANMLSVSMNLPALNILYKCHHIIYVHSWLISFT